jgi:hypothetical protein
VDLLQEASRAPQPAPPPADVLSGWTYDEESRAYFTEVGGFMSAWDGRHLSRYDGHDWVDWYDGGGADDEDTYEDEYEDEDEYQNQAEPARDDQPAAPPQTMSGEGIDWFNKEFD